jgi:hypothetical protein
VFQEGFITDRLATVNPGEIPCARNECIRRNATFISISAPLK